VTDHIALVSETAQVSLDELTQVAAAVQKQVTRDASPIWNLSATVDAFGTLDDIPPGYWHVLIRDDVPGDEAGIHQLDGTKQPYALVQFGTQWSLTTSHEVLEMLVDPFGSRLSAGDSPKPDQGRVLFLVEICDPCQSATVAYTVNGVLVSDFCTPEYFAPTGTSGAQYSFTGAVIEPRQVLADGYLTWVYPPTGHLWQLLMEDGQRRLTDVGPQATATACLRQGADRPRAVMRERALAQAPRAGLKIHVGAGGGRPTVPQDPTAAAIAAELRRQVQRQIAAPGAPANGN
jgi:hypothetical protein